jgi:uncharacterized coiled-coil protein SlyX
MDAIQFLPQVAGGGTLLIIGYGLKLLIDFLTQRQSGQLEHKKLDMAEDTQQVTDAAAANAILLASLQAVQADNVRKDTKIDSLEARNAEKDTKIEELQRTVRELRVQVHVLLQRLDGVDFELDDLRDNH